MTSACAIVKKQEAKEMVNPLWEKAQGFWHQGGHPTQKGSHQICQRAPCISLQPQKTFLKNWLKVHLIIN